MLLTEFSVENFGVFKGKHIFDFRAGDKGRPIVLFGGRNGTGKTTLFEGIKLCLYGASFRGQRLARPQYEDYLRSKIHRRIGLAESEGSSVSLELEHVHQGRVSKYFVRRYWTILPEGVREGLDVLRDGRPLDEITSQQLQDFLVELIPLGLSRLFFFDGEMIQKLAEDEPNNRNLIDAFNALLGIDILEHLQTDLRIHLSRQLKELASTPELSYERLLDECKLLSVEAANLRQGEAQKQTEIDHMSAVIERKEHDLASRGGGFAERRKYLHSRKVEVEAEISLLESTLRDMASSLFPFAISPALCLSLRDRLHKEEKYQQEVAAAQLLHKATGTVKENLVHDEFWEGIPLDESNRALVTDRFLEVLRSAVTVQHDDKSLLHRLSQGDQQKLLRWIEDSLDRVPIEFHVVTAKLESKTRELQSLESELSRVPPDEAVSPIIQQLNQIYQQLGELNHQKKLLHENLRQAEARLAENQRKVQAAQQEHERIDDTRKRADLGKQVQQTLREFGESLRREKILEVSERFVEAFNQLSTKRNLISRLQIDPGTFSTILLRGNGTSVPKESLSAGEKQVYAIAMLIALARVSGRPLPFIIDTPLARLDSEHRTNLVARFFPYVSHQVIVFSTNSEIDQDYFARLKPYVSRAYLLTYDDSSERSNALSGYFWESKLEVVA